MEGLNALCWLLFWLILAAVLSNLTCGCVMEPECCEDVDMMLAPGPGGIPILIPSSPPPPFCEYCYDDGGY